MGEIGLASELGGARHRRRGLGRPVEKINVGALGNVTPQLHLHVLGRVDVRRSGCGRGRSGAAASPSPMATLRWRAIAARSQGCSRRDQGAWFMTTG